MILLTQNGKNYVNFDNVNAMEMDDDLITSAINIRAHFNNGTHLIIGTFKNKEYGKEVFQDLMMDYRGNALIEVPKDKIKERPHCGNSNGRSLKD